MTRIKRLLIVMVLGGFVLGASGCVDMTAVPGVVILQGGDHQIVYLEASACARPVIAGRSGGATEAVEDGVTGLLVTPTDSCAIAGAVVALMTDTALAKALGAEGRNRVEREFAWHIQAQKLRTVMARG